METLTLVEKQINCFKQQFLQLNQAGIEDLLDTNHLHQMVGAAIEDIPHNMRDRIWTPLVTLFAFIKQALTHGSCSDAVKSVQAERFGDGLTPCSGNTSAYCQARQKLPYSLPSNLVRYTGEQLEKASRLHWCWRGRAVKLADGSTLTMADTPANQAEYPQESNQKEGIGFPILRIEITASLNSGGVLDFGVAPYSGKGTGESALLRKLMRTSFQSGDIGLFDRYYDNYWTIAELLNRGVDLLCPARGGRKIDWKDGVPIKGDYYDREFELKKPARPEWMSCEEYAAFPDKIVLRIFRIYGKNYITTLLDSRQYRKNALRKLYRQRWKIEVDLKFIKQIMKMEPLQCKTPEMVRKEIAIFLLAYNLIRLFMLQAAVRYHVWPCRISFAEALGTLKEYALRLAEASGEILSNWVEYVLKIVVSKRIGNRDGRSEPRMLKRRCAQFPYLTEPRGVVKQKILDRQNSRKTKANEDLLASFVPT